MSDQFYIYRFEDALRSTLYSGVGHAISFNDEVYAPVSISHSQPTFSSDPSQSRITVRLRDDLSVALNYISHPPPYATYLQIFEVLAAEISGNSLIATE